MPRSRGLGESGECGTGQKRSRAPETETATSRTANAIAPERGGRGLGFSLRDAVSCCGGESCGVRVREALSRACHGSGSGSGFAPPAPKPPGPLQARMVKLANTSCASRLQLPQKPFAMRSSHPTNCTPRPYAAGASAQGEVTQDPGTDCRGHQIAARPLSPTRLPRGFRALFLFLARVRGTAAHSGLGVPAAGTFRRRCR